MSDMTIRLTGVPLLRGCTNGGGGFFLWLTLSAVLAMEGAMDDAKELDVFLLTGSGGGLSSSSTIGTGLELADEVSADGFVGFGGGRFFSAGDVVDAMLGVLPEGELDPGGVDRGGILVVANTSCARIVFISRLPSD